MSGLRRASDRTVSLIYRENLNLIQPLRGGKGDPMKPGPGLRLHQQRLLDMISFVEAGNGKKRSSSEDLRRLKGGVKVCDDAMKALLHDALKGHAVVSALNEAEEVHAGTFLGKLLRRIREGSY